MAKDAPDGTLIMQVAVTLGQDSLPPSAVTEIAILRLSRLTTSSSSYATVISYVVPDDKTFVLKALELACSDYTKGQYRITIAGEEQFAGKFLQTTFNPQFPDVSLSEGQEVLIEGKSDGTNSIIIDGAIEGKEVG